MDTPTTTQVILLQVMSQVASDFLENQVDSEPEILAAIDEGFWDLIYGENENHDEKDKHSGSE